MTDHTGHSATASHTPDSTTKKAPEKPAQPDPHAGHDMGKHDKMPAPPKPPAGK